MTSNNRQRIETSYSLCWIQQESTKLVKSYSLLWIQQEPANIIKRLFDSWMQQESDHWKEHVRHPGNQATWQRVAANPTRQLGNQKQLGELASVLFRITCMDVMCWPAMGSLLDSKWPSNQVRSNQALIGQMRPTWRLGREVKRVGYKKTRETETEREPRKGTKPQLGNSKYPQSSNN